MAFHHIINIIININIKFEITSLHGRFTFPSNACNHLQPPSTWSYHPPNSAACFGGVHQS